MSHLVETSDSESLTPMSFRGSSEDKKIMEILSEKLNVKPSTIPRIAIRLLNDLANVPRLTEAMGRVKVFSVSHVIQDGRGKQGVFHSGPSVVETGKTVVRQAKKEALAR